MSAKRLPSEAGPVVRADVRQQAVVRGSFSKLGIAGDTLFSRRNSLAAVACSLIALVACGKNEAKDEIAKGTRAATSRAQNFISFSLDPAFRPSIADALKRSQDEAREIEAILLATQAVDGAKNAEYKTSAVRYIQSMARWHRIYAKVLQHEVAAKVTRDVMLAQGLAKATKLSESHEIKALTSESSFNETKHTQIYVQLLKATGEIGYSRNGLSSHAASADLASDQMLAAFSKLENL